MTDLIGDDKQGAFSVHQDLQPITVKRLEWHHQRYLERGDTATALVLARLAASDAANELWIEIGQCPGGEYEHPAGLVSVWSDPDFQPEVRKLHSDYLKRHPNGDNWRDVRKWLDSAQGPQHELWERQWIVADLLAMFAERVTRSGAHIIAEIARQERKASDAAALLRRLSKAQYPNHAALFTSAAQDDPQHNLKQELRRVEDELFLALYVTLSWAVGSLGYRIIAGLVGAALGREIDWQRVRYVIEEAIAKVIRDLWLREHPGRKAREFRGLVLDLDSEVWKWLCGLSDHELTDSQRWTRQWLLQRHQRAIKRRRQKSSTGKPAKSRP